MRPDELERELQDVLPDPEPDESAEERAALEEIRALARRQLELAADASLEDIQAAFGADLWAFWDFFYADYRLDPRGREIPPADFHVEFAGELQRIILDGRPGEELPRAYPREHAKSVWASLVAPTWALAHEHRWFGILFSDTASQAEGMLLDVRTEVETNERLQAIYPDFCAWELEPRTNRLAFGNGTTLMAFGSGKSVRGARRGSRRPDLIILDDIENDEEVENPNRRKKKMRWYNRVVKKLGRVAVLVIVGTILHAESFLAQKVPDDSAIHAALVTEPTRQDLWQEWERIFHNRGLPDSEAAARAFYTEHQVEMDAGASVLWPARFGLYELMVERAEDLASFLSERQNKPFDPSASWFPEDRLVWRASAPKSADVVELPPDSDIVLSVAFWDPARGTSKGDTSSLVRLDCYLDGSRHVRESETDRIPPEAVMEAGVGMHKRRRFDAWGVEKVGLSSYDETLQALGKSLGLALPVVPHTPTGSKDIRIKSLRPLVVSSTLTFDDGLPLEAKRQIKFYPSHPNDDFPDAVHAANQIADEYLAGAPPASLDRDATPDEMRVDRADVFGRSSLHDDVGERPQGLGSRILGLLGMRA